MSAPCSEEPPFPVGLHGRLGRAMGLTGIAEDGGPLLLLSATLLTTIHPSGPHTALQVTTSSRTQMLITGPGLDPTPLLSWS